MNALLYTTVDPESGMIIVPNLKIGLVLTGVVLYAVSLLVALQWSQAFQLSIQNLKDKHKEEGINEEEAAYVIACAVTVLIILLVVIVFVILRKKYSVSRVKNKRKRVTL